MNKHVALLLIAVVASPCVAEEKKGKKPKAIDQARVNRVLRDVERIVQVKNVKQVPGSFVTRADFQKHSEQQFEMLFPQQRLAGTLAMVKALGLVPRAIGDVKTLLKKFNTPAIAYYNAATKKMHFIGDKTSDGTLFHELVHAVQDQRHDLIKLSRLMATNGTLDNLVALKFLVEGEATLWTKIYGRKSDKKVKDYSDVSARFLLGGFKPLTSKQIVRNLQANSKNNPQLLFAAIAMRLAPRIMVRFAYLPYTTGDNAAFYVVKRHGAAGLHKLYQQPLLLNSRDMLFAKEVLGQQWGIEKVTLKQRDRPDGVAWKMLHRDTLGAFIWHTLLEDKPELANEICAAWSGDTVELWKNKKAERLIGIVSFHNEDAAKKFAAEFKAKKYEVKVEGRKVRLRK